MSLKFLFLSSCQIIHHQKQLNWAPDLHCEFIPYFAFIFTGLTQPYDSAVDCLNSILASLLSVEIIYQI